ncbi:hypothetical protein [Caulobacter sp. 17J65-9]|uniref:hypothetical protein n=1 Tax=Caulobacter sp. 17J65-9 TaxID=2709382 RepID=UPI0013C8A919|nr:hypothetical protein [Caulobacter sp. 17J65-9]NEX92366.1 hypothetical protein [Caulobacter sp. 17J65-9]
MELISPLPRDECVRRLESVVDPSLLLFGSKPLRGGVSAGGFHVSKRTWYRNDFKTWMSGSFESHGAGTRVRCRFGMHPLTLVFFAIWFGAVGLMGWPLIAAGAGAAIENPSLIFEPTFWIMAIPLGMVVFGAAIVGFGRLLATGEQGYLEAIVRRTLEAA